MRLIAILLFCMPQAAFAEMTLEPGRFFVLAQEYDADTNAFGNAPPEGSGDACFSITKVDRAAQTVGVRLEAGRYKPWWSPDVLEPGFTDLYTTENPYQRNNPDAHWTEFLSLYFHEVPSCPSPKS